MATGAKRIVVIIPAYNEAKNLPSVIDGLRSHAPHCDLCVVDDGSLDATARVASALGATLLKCPVNLGIGGAVQTGYLWALDRGYDIAVQVDGDGQHNASYLGALTDPIASGRADLVIGSRFLASEGFRSTAIRRVGIRYLSWFLRARCGARVTDPTSGFRAASGRAIELFARHYSSDYPEPESIAAAARSGLRVLEIPVRMEPRRHGKSSIDAARTLYYLAKVTLALLLLPWDSRAPLPMNHGTPTP